MLYGVLAVAAQSLWAATRLPDEPSIIPAPVRLERMKGEFTLGPDTRIVVGAGASALEAIAKPFKSHLPRLAASRPATGVLSSSGEIHLSLVERPDLLAEGYELLIEPDRITIQAPKPTGVFYGLQVLRQLLPADVGQETRGAVSVPCLRIEDRPRFAWRGLLLDCSRTFLPKQYLMRYVDLLAFYRMNVLHLHLTDDQGWRLAIDKYPRLTEIGARFDPRYLGEVNGYYSKADIRELLTYAAERFVTIVPELEMPSHCLAALTAYPELSCRTDAYFIAPYAQRPPGPPATAPDQATEPHKQLERRLPWYARQDSPYGVFCAGNEQVFEMLSDVLNEVIDLFPSPYIHIGGDECPKEFWQQCPKCQTRMKQENLKDTNELQSYFIKRIERIIHARGRKLLGWDEILDGDLPPRAAVMSWRGVERGVASARQGRNVVMAPLTHCYFDYPYARTSLKQTWSFDPIPAGLTAEQGLRVLGAQGCMWTHIARTEPQIDAMILPRLMGLAEAVWSPPEKDRWKDFRRRTKPHYRRLHTMGFSYTAASEDQE